MPNTFIALDVPATDTTGVPAITTLLGSPKTFVFAADRPPGGRYVIEASNDGGNTWDILVGLDGTEAASARATTGGPGDRGGSRPPARPQHRQRARRGATLDHGRRAAGGRPERLRRLRCPGRERGGRAIRSRTFDGTHQDVHAPRITPRGRALLDLGVDGRRALQRGRAHQGGQGRR